MLSTLTEKSLAVILAYSPTGLGHLRVTDALYHGLPEKVHTILLGSNDTLIRDGYRLISSNLTSRKIMEFLQKGKAEKLITPSIRSFLRFSSGKLFSEVSTVLDQRIVVAKTILFVATHSDQAHQIASIKGRLEREKKVKVFLMVQVTDDSPQASWYVPGADIIFVPSHKTKKDLVEYGKNEGLKEVHIEVNPYPVSPLLQTPLSEKQLEIRENQIKRGSSAKLNITVPVSGAAVGTDYLRELILDLQGKLPRSFFYIVSKEIGFTNKFLKSLEGLSFVQILSATHDREVVDLYEKVFSEEVISLEVSKPSEQTFKVLLNPRQLGGVLMLFSEPVGRQEYDNLDFLVRHRLIPNEKEQKKLLSKALDNQSFQPEDNDFKEQVKTWRGLVLPRDSFKAASFITWCVKEGVFELMVGASVKPESPHHEDEISDSGVKRFWEKVDDFVKKNEANLNL